VSGWGPQGGRISPTRIARRGSRGNSVCPCYTFRVNVAPPAPDRSVSDWHSAVETRCQPFRRISHLGFGNSGNGKRSIRRVDDRSRPLTVQNPKNCLEETLSRASAKNWSLKTERDCTAPCNRAPIRNCSRRWPRAKYAWYAQVPSKFCRRSSHFGKSYISPPTQPHRFGTQDEQRSSDGGVGLAYPPRAWRARARRHSRT